MDNNTKQILEIITDIQEHMATKDDIKQMATKDDIKTVIVEMSEMRRDLQTQITENTKAIAELSEQIRSILGYAK